MDIELLKTKLYLAEVLLLAEWNEGDHRRDPKTGMFSTNPGSVASKLKDAATAVKNGVQDFVQSIFSQETLDKMSELDPTKEARKAIGETFNDIGRTINTNIRKAVTDAIDNVKDFSIGNIISHAVNGINKYAHSHQEEVTEALAAAVGVVGAIVSTIQSVRKVTDDVFGGHVSDTLFNPVRKLIWTAIGPVVYKAVSPILPDNITIEITSQKISSDQVRQNQNKVKAVISQPLNKRSGQEDEENKFILDNFGANTEPSKSFKEKYKEKNSKEYNKELDTDVTELDNTIISLTRLYTNKLVEYHDRLQGDSASLYQKQLKDIQQDIESTVEERKKYYDS